MKGLALRWFRTSLVLLKDFYDELGVKKSATSEEIK
jgi:hypothetical protein